MKLIGRLIIAAFLALIASDARAQEANLSLNVEGVAQQMQRTPALVIHEAVTLPTVVKNPTAAPLKPGASPTKNSAAKTPAVDAASAVGSPSQVTGTAAIYFPALPPAV